MTVYIDLYFTVNFIVDFIILTLSCKKCISPTSHRLLAAFFGAAYACLSLWDTPWIFTSAAGEIIVLFLMCALSLFPCSFGVILKSSVKAFAVSQLFGGIALTILRSAGFSYGSPIPDFIIAAAIAISGLCIKLIGDSIMQKSDGFCLFVEHNGRKITLSGKCDSGNSLKSFDGLPVVVADFDSLKKLFPKIVSPTQLSEFVSPCDFRIIPYSTISDSGTLYGFVPNRITTEKNKAVNAVIAAAPTKLKVQILYSPELLNY